MFWDLFVPVPSAFTTGTCLNRFMTMNINKIIKIKSDTPSITLFSSSWFVVVGGGDILLLLLVVVVLVLVVVVVVVVVIVVVVVCCCFGTFE